MADIPDNNKFNDRNILEEINLTVEQEESEVIKDQNAYMKSLPSKFRSLKNQFISLEQKLDIITNILTATANNSPVNSRRNSKDIGELRTFSSTPTENKGLYIAPTIDVELFRKEGRKSKSDDRNKGEMDVKSNKVFDPRRKSVAFGNLEIEDPYNNDDNIAIQKGNKLVKIMKKIFQHTLPDNPAAIDIYKLGEDRASWELSNQQSADMQNVLTDQLRALIQATFVTGSGREFIFEEVPMRTSVQETRLYNNKQVMAVLIALVLPLSQVNYNDQFIAISNYIWHTCSNDNGSWRSGSRYVNTDNISNMYLSTIIYLEKARSIVVMLTDVNTEINSEESVQIIPPLSLWFGNKNQIAFADTLLEQIGIFGTQLQRSNNLVQKLHLNRDWNHLQFIEYVENHFKTNHFSKFMTMKKDLILFTEQNTCVRSSKRNAQPPPTKAYVPINANIIGNVEEDVNDFDNDSLEGGDVDKEETLNNEEEDFIQDFLYNINNQTTSPFTKSDFKSTPSKSIAGNKSRGTCMASFYSSDGKCPIPGKCIRSHKDNDLDKTSEDSLEKLIKFRKSKGFSNKSVKEKLLKLADVKNKEAVPNIDCDD
jgi:hypothetical protein